MPSRRACVVVGLLALGGDEAGVVDEKVDVGEALRHDADVAALAVLVGARPKGRPLCTQMT